jgi:hypothetical protein
LVEQPHRSHADFLNALLGDPRHHGYDALLIDGIQALADAGAPTLVVGAHRIEHTRRFLHADHIAATVSWLADWPLPTRHFDLLAGHLQLVDVYQALQHCALECC